jgi:hypothetical protein
MNPSQTNQAIELILLTLDLGVGLMACLSVGLSALFTTTER